jgi:dienelactone hydrolase
MRISLFITFFCLSITPAFADRPLTYEEDVGASWRAAVVFVTKPTARLKVDTVKLDKPYPTVLFLHGCAGLYPTAFESDLFQWAEYIANLGFVVVMPDSLARPNRVPNCVPGKPGESGKFPKALQYRFQEISYAMLRLKELPWVDKDNIFLMGHSEGGNATARQAGGGFRGLIISGWTCSHKKNPNVRGINAPQDIPALAIAYTQDPFFHGKDTEGRCADVVKDREIIQIDLPGIAHGTYGELRARNAVTKFLSDKLSRKQ